MDNFTFQAQEAQGTQGIQLARANRDSEPATVDAEIAALQAEVARLKAELSRVIDDTMVSPENSRE